MCETPNSAIPLFILHWNRPDECLNSLNALDRQNLALDITVIDNASEAAALQELSAKLPKGVALRKLSENKGWGGAFNVLISEWLATKAGEFCFVCAHDALPDSGCLQSLLQAIRSDSKVGIASPVYERAEIPAFSALKGARSLPVSERPAGTVEYVPYPHGTLMLLRSKCLAEVGLFDESYFAYGDEFDLGLRCNSAGWKIALVWDAKVVNPGSWTASKLKTYLFARNSLILAERHGSRGAAWLRALLMLANGALLTFVPPLRRGKYFSESFLSLRLQAVCDYLRGALGRPRMLQQSAR